MLSVLVLSSSLCFFRSLIQLTLSISNVALTHFYAHLTLCTQCLVCKIIKGAGMQILRETFEGLGGCLPGVGGEGG